MPPRGAKQPEDGAHTATPAGVSQGEFITIARVVKPQGRVGEVSAELFTDFPERFAERRHLFALGTTGNRRELELEDFWPHKGRMILKFAGIDNIDAAANSGGSRDTDSAGTASPTGRRLVFCERSGGLPGIREHGKR